MSGAVPRKGRRPIAKVDEIVAFYGSEGATFGPQKPLEFFRGHQSQSKHLCLPCQAGAMRVRSCVLFRYKPANFYC